MSSENLIHCIQNVHVKELVKRLNWSVKIRWYYISLSALLIAAVYFLLDDHLINLHYDYLIVAYLFLIVCNFIYHYQLQYSYEKCLSTSELRNYLFLQIITDYLALTLVIYTFGSIETPLILMIIPNTIFATLFFTPRQSFLIVLLGLFMVITPLILEFFQIIPVISIFNYSLNASFKSIVLSETIIVFGYIFMLFSGVIFCWYLLCSITTKLIKNELDLEHSYQDMIKLDKEKTHATLRSTHELKAPLAAIKNYVYVMNAGYAGEVNDKVMHIIHRIGKRCDYLLNNVSDIIKLGNLKSYMVVERTEDIKSNDPFHPVNIVHYINDFVLQNNNLTHEKNIKIKVDNQLSDMATHEVEFIMANDENLQLIFSNLLINAINYSQPDGLIDIIISRKIPPHTHPSEVKKNICVSIKDHGIGIDKKQLKQVFEEHFRANNAVQYYEGGTGLGLSIVKICSRIINADVHIESTLNQGTIVTICFNSGETSYD